jgi:molecular chaperone HtpG
MKPENLVKSAGNDRKMTTETKKETLGFQTEVKQLLDLMIHSLYSNREIFLRELISNASDAADKLRFDGLKDDSLFEDDPDLKIRVEYNADQKTVSVIDNGIGMSRDDVIEHLGTIAKSGTKQFFQSLTGEESKDNQLIGQFGVGFYSSFIVAKKVEVQTRKAGLSRQEGVRWTSSGESDFEIETIDRPKRGTRVTLYLRDEAEEFANGYSLKTIIRKYSDHISLPIIMPEEGEDEDGKEKTGEETVNSATALWTRVKKEISEEEYHEFYKHVGHDFQEPLGYVHNKVEGKVEYSSLLYIPSHAPFDMWDRDKRHGVKLYVKRIFIMDDAEQLIPSYLRFVRGVVDSDDLPLNISREILQRNKTIDSIRSGCTKKVLDLLKSIAEKDEEKYASFWNEFGKVLKEGVIDEQERRDDLMKLFRFASTHNDDDTQNVSLQDYVGRMKEGQKEIYFITAESYATAKNSPHLEIFNKKDIEVLLLIDPIDEWVVTHITEFEEKNLQSVNKGELDLDNLGEKKEEDDKDKDDDKQHEDLVKRIKDILSDKVTDVRITNRLTTSPACLVVGDEGMGRHLEQILKASGQAVPAAKPILEVNPEHPIVIKLNEESIEERITDWAHILYDQALLSEGGQLEDPAGFVHRLNNLMMQMADGT